MMRTCAFLFATGAILATAAFLAAETVGWFLPSLCTLGSVSCSILGSVVSWRRRHIVVTPDGRSYDTDDDLRGRAAR